MKTVMILSGGCDPIHSGHISMIKHAKSIADVVIVGINSDAWLTRKKGVAFMPAEERRTIVSNIKGVDLVLEFNDDDGSANDLIRTVRALYPDDHIIFGNGGDRQCSSNNIPEAETCEKTGVVLMDGVGGYNKAASSSDFLKDYSKYVETKNAVYGTSVITSEGEKKLAQSTFIPKAFSGQIKASDYLGDYIRIKFDSPVKFSLYNRSTGALISTGSAVNIKLGHDQFVSYTADIEVSAVVGAYK